MDNCGWRGMGHGLWLAEVHNQLQIFYDRFADVPAGQVFVSYFKKTYAPRAGASL